MRLLGDNKNGSNLLLSRLFWLWSFETQAEKRCQVYLYRVKSVKSICFVEK